MELKQDRSVCVLVLSGSELYEHGNKSANSIEDLELIHEIRICQESTCSLNQFSE
jgi:hypothetical protein